MIELLNVLDKSPISSRKHDEYEISDTKKKLHSFLFDYALQSENKEDVHEIYNSLLFKRNFEHNVSGPGTAGYVRRFDYGAEHLLSEQNKKHLLERIEAPDYSQLKDKITIQGVEKSVPSVNYEV